MNIKKTVNGSTMVIALDDRLDNVTAPELDKELRKGLPGVENLIWDFSDLEYITSAGLRELMIARKMLLGEGNMKVIHTNEMVREVFNLTGLDFLLGEE